MNKIKRLGVLEYLKELVEPDFVIAFCVAAGYIGADAERDPDAIYKVREVQELFDYLFSLRQQNEETPAGGAARESGN